MENNIEEDIKILEDIIFEKKALSLGKESFREVQALENVLNDCKKNQKIVDNIKSEIKRLEKEQAEDGEDYYDEYEYEITLLSNLLEEE